MDWDSGGTSVSEDSSYIFCGFLGRILRTPASGTMSRPSPAHRFLNPALVVSPPLSPTTPPLTPTTAPLSPLSPQSASRAAALAPLRQEITAARASLDLLQRKNSALVRLIAGLQSEQEDLVRKWQTERELRDAPHTNGTAPAHVQRRARGATELSCIAGSENSDGTPVAAAADRVTFS